MTNMSSTLRAMAGRNGDNRSAAAPSRAHRYKLGDEVTLSRGFGYARVAGAVYEITALLPTERMLFQYRIRSKSEAFSRVATECELAPRRGGLTTEGPLDAQGPAAEQSRKAEAQAG